MKKRLKEILFDKPNNMYILIANVVINITWVFLLGLFINKSLEKTLIIIIVWSLSLKMGKPKHYKSPLKCFLMQVVLFSSIYISTFINIYIACIFTVYSKFLFSGWADIDGVEEESDKSFHYMVKALEDFIKVLEEEAETQEQKMQLRQALQNSMR